MHQTLNETYTIPSARSMAISALKIGSGTLLLAGLSQLQIPLTPIPVTLQTLGVMSLGLFYSPAHAASSAALYLAAATIGLPVLAGGISNPFWMFTLKAGYLLSFPFAAYSIASLRNMFKSAPALSVMAALLIGQAIIYAGGLSILSFFTGFSAALSVGLYPFVTGEVLKVGAAFCAYRAYKNGKSSA